METINLERDGRIQRFEEGFEAFELEIANQLSRMHNMLAVKLIFDEQWELELRAEYLMPHGIACGEHLIKECEEEAGIPRSLSSRAVPVGAVSYMDIDGYGYKRDVLFCYDLKLPEDFVPKNQDGEVEGFQLIPVTQAANVIRRTEFYKPNCSLVIIDFLFRHGYICPEYYGYLDLLQSLRSGDCS
ncbi:hypothetical protein LWI28_003851 [Acer negundo]|uniref:Nudix hydrolase domain-containing protein n=1 Tax=Acer negundo TaxID=4023 RepID=A0AAD5P003_ACENE|nr:hypothetical protein LWI28_003851 [Acer negundo]